MKQTDKDFLLINRCRNDEQRIKLLEFYRFLESAGIPYELHSVRIGDLHLKPETVGALGLEPLADQKIEFDIMLSSRKLVMNLFSSTRFVGSANKTDASIRFSVSRALKEYSAATGWSVAPDEYRHIMDALVVAVRQHLVALNITFPVVLDIKMESPWFWGEDIEIWLLRGANFDNLCASLLV